MGSSCIYPKNANQPINENDLLTGLLEYTNEPYAIAKIAGMKMCESFNLQYGTNFISIMPTNIYGPNDNFDFESSHVIPAIIRKVLLAKCFYEENMQGIKENLGITSQEAAVKFIQKVGIYKEYVILWGTGRPKREFLWSEDMADACTHIMENVNFEDLYSENDNDIRNTHINIGTGEDIAIYELANVIKDIVGYKGEVRFDSHEMDGTPRKLCDVSRMEGLGWKYRTELKNGL